MTSSIFKESEKILILKLAGIGDFILALPALKVFCLQKKGVLLCTERIVRLAKRYPYFKEVFFLREPFLSFKTLFPNLKTILLLRKGRFDLCMNFHEIGSLRGSLMMFLLILLLRPKRSAGLGGGGKDFFFTYKLHEKKKVHEMEKYLHFVSALTGKSVEIGPPEFILLEKDEVVVDRLLKERGIISDKPIQTIVGFQPGGNKKKFLWPISHFAMLAQHLHKRYGASIVVIGNAKERILAENLQREVDFPIKSLCGFLPLEGVPSLMRRFHLFVSNDSGLAHIAGAVGVPLVVIFGPFSEERFIPFHKNKKMLVIHRKDVSCIAEIPSQDVIQKIDAFLGKE